MNRSTSTTLVLMAAGVLAITMIILLAQMSPVATTLAALFFLVLLLTFVMPELTLHLVVLSMLLSPEMALTAVPGTRGGHNELTLRIEDFLLMFLGMAWLARLAIFKEVSQIARSPVNGAILLYLGACILSTLVGVVMGNVAPTAGGLYLLKYFEYYFLYYMIIMTVNSEAEIKRLLTTFFATAAIIVIVAVAQIPGGERVTAPFEGEVSEPNTLGGYLVIVLGMSLGFLSHATHYWSNITWAAVGFSLLVPLGYTLSRVSWLSLVPMAFAYIVVNYRRRIFLVTMGTMFTVTLVVVLAPADLTTRIGSRVEETFTPGQGAATVETVFGTAVDESTSLRIKRYKDVLAVLGKNPLFGTGITGWGMSDAMYPRVLGETGILGFAAFIWLLGLLIRENRRVARAIGEGGSMTQKAIVTGHLLVTAALAIHAMGADTFIIVRIMEPYWLITALTFVLPYIVPAQAPAAASDPHEVPLSSGALAEEVRGRPSEQHPLTREVHGS